MDKAAGRPPLEVFRFFDVAGRHQSFAKAARELGLTPGTVAYRVRKLEHYWASSCSNANRTGSR